MASIVQAKPANEQILGKSLTYEIMEGCSVCDSSFPVAIVILKLLTTHRMGALVILDGRASATRSNEQSYSDMLEAPKKLEKRRLSAVTQRYCLLGQSVAIQRIEASGQ